MVYCAAVGPYFKTGQLSPIDLIVETQFHRAAPGGMGGTKCAGEEAWGLAPGGTLLQRFAWAVIRLMSGYGQCTVG